MVSMRTPLALLSTALRPIGRRTAVSLTGAFCLSSFTSRAQGPSVTTCTARTMSSPTVDTGFLDAASASALDQELMSEPGFSLEQLMELAGLSVAEAVYQVVQEKRLDHQPRILLVCGPGNNGGDGLVAARHLVMFGYQSTVVYPKQVKKQHYINLVQQCEDVGIQIREDLPEDLSEYDAIVDAIFGFSFHGTPRPPFDTILQAIANAEALTVAVDVPSGWNVDKGDVAGTGFVPDVLVSLTAPKLSAKQFTGRHFVGGRFLPPALGEKYGVRMPRYPGVAQVVEVGKTRRPADWEEGYAAYLAEKQAKEEAAASGQSWADQESWEHQYAAYLAEKEAKEREGSK